MKGARIEVHWLVVVITAIFAAVIPTLVGALAWISPTHAPLYFEGSHDVMLSWGARSLGLAMAGWLALLVVRDARGYAVVLGASATREVLDLIDLLGRAEGPARAGVYVMLPLSSTCLLVALALSLWALRKHSRVADAPSTAESASSSAPV